MHPKLVATQGPIAGSSFTLPEREGTIGRAAYNWLVIPSPTLSRQHCLVELDQRGWKLVDLESHNGTLVNGQPVREHRLAHHDRIQLGETALVFLTEDEELPVDPDDSALVTRSLLEIPGSDPEYLAGAHDRAPDAERNLRALLRFSSAIQTARSTAELSRELLDRTFEIIPASRAVLYWKEGGELRFLIERGEPLEALPPNAALLSQADREMTCVLSEESVAGTTCRQVLAAPLIASRHTAGVLYLEAPRGSLTEDHLQLAAAIGSLAAAALDNVRRAEQLECENRRLREEIALEHGIIGESDAIRKVIERLARVAPTGATVLILGEHGTGKELAARAIHNNSARAAKPFVAVNCAALKDTLLESELFGHDKGAFTGAVAQKAGRIEIAEGGTLFLDEIGDLDRGMQSKLLRVLQEREYERVGGTRTLKADVRLVAATNRDLGKSMRSGEFRDDLYYRLAVVTITMPPLRERRQDIALLARHFLEKYASRSNRSLEGIHRGALSILERHDWPGNVRELQNTIERAVVLGDSPQLMPEDLPEALLDRPDSDGIPRLHSALQDAKRQKIREAIRNADGNISEAARQLGVHPNYLHRLVTKLGLRDEF